jgi:hypothetical protein
MPTLVPASMVAADVATQAELDAVALRTTTSGTVVSPASGASIDFTGIPNWARRVVLSFAGLSTNGTSQPMFQIGTSGGIQTTGYSTASSSITSGANASVAYTNGWQLFSSAATSVLSGSLTLMLVDAATGTWAATGSFSGNGPSILFTNGSKVLSGTLDRVRLTTAGGVDVFDAGAVNITYD